MPYLNVFFFLQDIEEGPSRRMDRLRRSLRSSLRRKKDRSGGGGSGFGGGGGGGSETDGSTGGGGGGTGATTTTAGGGKPNLWHADETSVRSGTCSFQVKVRENSGNFVAVRASADENVRVEVNFPGERCVCDEAS